MAVVAAAVAAYALTRGAAQGDAALAAAASRGAAGSAASGAGGPPVSVSLVTVQKRDVDVMLDATGTVTALNSVEVRPQIAQHHHQGAHPRGPVRHAPASCCSRSTRATTRSTSPRRGRSSPRTRRRWPTRSASWRAAGPVRAELHLAGRGRHQPDAGRCRSAPWSRPTARRSRRRRSRLSYSRIAAPTRGTRRRDQRLPRQLRAAEPARAGDDHPARPDRRRLQPAAAQPRPRRWRRCAAAAARSRRRCPKAAAQLPGKLQFVDNAVDAASGTVQGQGRVRQPGRAALAGRLRQRPRSTVQTLKGASVDSAGGDHPERRAARWSTSSTPAARRRRGRSRCSTPSGDDAAVSGVKAGERVVARRPAEPASRGDAWSSAPGRRRRAAGAAAPRRRLRRRRRRLGPAGGGAGVPSA